MNEAHGKEINVYKVALMQQRDSVGIFLGYCDPARISKGKVNDDDVSNVQSIVIPIEIISDVIKQLMEAGIEYQELTRNVVLDVKTNENGVKSVHF